MATRCASAFSAARWSRTTCRALQDRWPAFWPLSTGPPSTVPISWVLSVATDAPFLPRDLVARLHAARLAEGKALACAKSGDQVHPVIGLWPVTLRADLRHALVVEDIRKIDRWTARHGCAEAVWPVEPFDPFFNANSPDDLTEAEAVLMRHRDA